MPWNLLGILLAVCAVLCAVGFYKFVYFLSIGYGFAVAGCWNTAVPRPMCSKRLARKNDRAV